MRLRRLLLLVLLAAGAFALLRRRAAEDTWSGVDVWFDDGSSVSLERSSHAGERLTELADAVLAAAR